MRGRELKDSDTTYSSLSLSFSSDEDEDSSDPLSMGDQIKSREMVPVLYGDPSREEKLEKMTDFFYQLLRTLQYDEDKLRQVVRETKDTELSFTTTKMHEEKMKEVLAREAPQHRLVDEDQQQEPLGALLKISGEVD